MLYIFFADRNWHTQTHSLKNSRAQLPKTGAKRVQKINYSHLKLNKTNFHQTSDSKTPMMIVFTTGK